MRGDIVSRACGPLCLCQLLQSSKFGLEGNGEGRNLWLAEFLLNAIWSDCRSASIHVVVETLGTFWGMHRDEYLVNRYNSEVKGSQPPQLYGSRAIPDTSCLRHSGEQERNASGKAGLKGVGDVLNDVLGVAEEARGRVAARGREVGPKGWGSGGGGNYR